MKSLIVEIIALFALLIVMISIVSVSAHGMFNKQSSVGMYRNMHAYNSNMNHDSYSINKGIMHNHENIHNSNMYGRIRYFFR